MKDERLIENERLIEDTRKMLLDAAPERWHSISQAGKFKIVAQPKGGVFAGYDVVAVVEDQESAALIANCPTLLRNLCNALERAEREIEKERGRAERSEQTAAMQNKSLIDLVNAFANDPAGMAECIKMLSEAIDSIAGKLLAEKDGSEKA